MTESFHIALVGCGFTGTSAFYQLVDRYPVTEITIFERSGEFGPGFPYRADDCDDYLINNATDEMCLVPSNKRAFVEWLKLHPEFVPEVDEKGHLPRRLYGAFLKDVFDSTCTIAAIKGIAIHLLPFEATSMHEDAKGKVHIDWPDGKTKADIAILTTGRCPDIKTHYFQGSNTTAQYIDNHIMSDDFDDMPLDATVHVLGASLSAYDVVNRLFSSSTGCRFERSGDGRLKYLPGDNKRRVVLCSRSARLKAVTGPSHTAINRHCFTLDSMRKMAIKHPLTLEKIASLIMRDAEAHGVHVDWKSIIEPYAGCLDANAVNNRAGALLEHAIRAARFPDLEASKHMNFLVDFFSDAQEDIWDAFAENLLSADAEILYRQKYETAVLCYTAPCPLPTAERLLALHQAGRLVVIKGTGKVQFKKDAGYFEINHLHGIEKANILVNTTGRVDRNVKSSNQPALIKHLVSKGLLSQYTRNNMEMKGAAVDMKSFRAYGSQNIYLANMLLWGPGFFTSSAFMMATIVERLLKSIFK